MENASRALIMAAGVLVGLMILSIAVYLFATFGAASAEVHSEVDANRINEFNTQFTAYEGKTNTIYDVITAANNASENNIYYELDKVLTGLLAEDSNYPDAYVQVNLKNDQFTSLTSIEKANNMASLPNSYNYNYDQIIQNDISSIVNGATDLKTYTCKTYISQVTGLVYRVDFTQQ